MEWSEGEGERSESGEVHGIPLDPAVRCIRGTVWGFVEAAAKAHDKADRGSTDHLGTSRET